MVFEPNIKPLIESLRVVLTQEECGSLSLGLRRRIWRALGPRVLNENQWARPSLGLRRRFALGVLCVENVMPRWEKILPDDRKPHQVLDDAKRHLDGNKSAEDLLETAANLSVHVDDLNYANRRNATVHDVGRAAASAAMIALVDELFDNEEKDEQITEFDVDSHDWDAAFYASIVYAGGTAANPNSSADKRREFWTWYLDVAVPSVL